MMPGTYLCRLPALWLGALMIASLLASQPRLLASPRPPYPPLPEIVSVLFHEDFDEAYTWGATNRFISLGDFTLVESWSGYALDRSGAPLTPFVLPGVDSNSHTNLSPRNGSLRFFFSPHWASASAGGSGPGHYAHLVDLIALDPDGSAVAWSLQANTNGSNLSLVAQTSGGATELLTANIAWEAESSHCVGLNFGTNGTELFIDGQLAASGDGTAPLNPLSSALVLGTSVSSSDPANGSFDEFYSFGRRQTASHYQFYYDACKDTAALGPISAEEQAALAAWRVERLSEFSFESFSGMDSDFSMGPSFMSLSSAGCITNGPPFMTNTACVYDPVLGWMVSFDVLGGSNQLFDVFCTTNLIGNNITNSQWWWVTNATTCSTVTLLNQSSNRSFYILGTQRDSDLDSLTDAYELLVSKTSPQLWDTDGDGVSDGWEVWHGMNPLDPSDACAATYSATNYFGFGFLQNLNYTNSYGRLELNSQAVPFKFLSLPCGADGTVVRFDTTTGLAVGEYRTAPTNRPSFPGHSTVDRFGNTWVANWDERGCLDGTGLGSVACVGIVIGGTRGDVQKNGSGVVTNFTPNPSGHYLQPPFDYCTAVDRDGDGYIKTSSGTNDVLNWVYSGTNTTVADADDECIIHYFRVPAQFASGLAFDTNGDLWVSGYCDASTPDCTASSVCGTKVHVKINPLTGQVLTNKVFASGGTSYGGFEALVDRNGVLWSSGGANPNSSFPSLVTYAAGVTNIQPSPAPTGDFGLALDPQTGNVWSTAYSANRVAVYTNATFGLKATYTNGSAYSGGLAIDNAGNVWVAHGPWNGGSTIGHLLTDGTFLENVDLTAGCSGVTPASTVVIDSDGKVWAICASQDGSTSPKLIPLYPGAGSLATNNGVIFHRTVVGSCLSLPGHGNRESYGDMTGQKLLSSIAPSGLWSFIHDGGATNKSWDSLSCSASTSDTNQVRVELRSANSIGQLSTNNFRLAQSGVALSSVSGRFLEVRVTLMKAPAASSPWLQSLSVQCAAPIAATLQFLSPTNSQLFVFSPTNILLSATGYSNPGTLTNAYFYRGTNLLGSAPFNTNLSSLLWTNAQAGTNTLTVKATNSAGTALSAIVTNIILNAMPTVSISAPTNLVERTNVTITATVSDSDGSVTNVQFYCQTNLPGIVSSNLSSWSLTWSNLPHGSYPVTAKATDNRGAVVSSSILLLQVRPTNPPPSVLITYPTSNMVFRAGADITITATATNTPASVTNVSFFANGILLGSDPDRPYSITECCWKPGVYQLTAQARDSFGSVSNSAPVLMIITNAVPTAGDGFWDPAFTLPDSILAVNCLAVSGSNLFCGVNFPDYSAGIYERRGADWEFLDPVELGYVDNVVAMASDGIGVCYATIDDNVVRVFRYDGTNATELGASAENLTAFIADSLYPKYLSLKFIGPDLYLVGELQVGTHAFQIAKYHPDDDTWYPVGDGPADGPIFAIESFQGDIVVGGRFESAGGQTNLHNIARLKDGHWTAYGTGVRGTNSMGTNSAIYTLAACGTNLFVGGDFQIAGDLPGTAAIAVWNGHNWRNIGGGLAGPSTVISPYALPTLAVFNICVRGDTIFAVGQFSGIYGLEPGQTLVSSVARARWSEDRQSWTWSDLDLGAFDGLSISTPGTLDGLVSSAVVMEGDPGIYDLVVGGQFHYAGLGMTNLSTTGPSYFQALARWRVGSPSPTNAPIISLVSPTNNALFTNNPSSLTLSATNLGTLSLSSVEFYSDGALLGTNSTTGATLFSYTWSGPANGVHLLKAIATGTNGIRGESKPVLISLKNATNSVVARDDAFTIIEGASAVTFSVLTNDTPTNGLRVGGLLQLHGSLGTAAIGHDGSYISYTPFAHAFGNDCFAYTITNSSGASDSAWISVHILSRPTASISAPLDGFRTGIASNITISCTSLDYDGQVTNLSLYANGVKFGDSSSSTHPFVWSTNTAGFYTFFAVATDNDGLAATSAPVTLVITNATASPHGPIALISNLVETNITQFSLDSDILPLVREGRFDLQGTASDPDGDSVSYAISLYRPEDLDFGISTNIYDVINGAAPFADLTPTPANPQGFHAGAVTNASLGTLDFTRFPNATYYLLLRVHGGTDETNAVVRFRLDSQLKIGQFSFSEQDLVLPVNGIPLTITRTYNSLRANGSPRPSDGRGAGGEGHDFGPGWTFALNSMDVQLDDERQDVTIGTPNAPFANDEEGDNGLPRVVSIRTGGGRDVMLTLPDGRRTTFAYTPFIGSFHAEAQWTAPPDVHATLIADPPGSEIIQFFPALQWQDGGDGSTYENHDIPGWVLKTQDGTKYYIKRGSCNSVTYQDTTAHYINVQAYDVPKLTSIVQRSGDRIDISDTGISHYNPTNGLTRSVFMERDEAGRIAAIHDPISGSNGLASVKYVYNRDTGNLIQVLKLVDRSAGSYVTNKYHYDNPAFPHYISSVENALGIPVARNEYDDSGRLTAVVDADGNRTEFIHSTTNSVERVIDRLGNTNTFAYDLRGNVVATTNALNGIMLMAYDDLNNKTNEIAYLNGQPYATNRSVFDANGFLLVSVNPLGFSNLFTYNEFGQVTNSTDARGFASTTTYDPASGNLIAASDAMSNRTSYFYDDRGLLRYSVDPLGTVTTNTYDSLGNLIGTAVLSIQSSGLDPIPVSTILSTNTFGYDQDGNRTNSTSWRRVDGTWTAAATTYVFDGQNRTIQRIDPDGGTNLVIFDDVGHQLQIVDKLGRRTISLYGNQGHLIGTIYPDLSTNTFSYDANDHRTNSVDQLGHITSYSYDRLGRPTETVFADNTTNLTVYDDLGRVKFSIDAGGTTNAFGYNAACQQVAVTNAWGTSVQMTNAFAYDPNGNQIYSITSQGILMTNIFDPLNRVTNVTYRDGTRTLTVYDATGRRIAETNQDNVATFFSYDGLSRLVAVTSALGITTHYQYDEAGNEVLQVDALGRTNRFDYDGLGRRALHTTPGGQTERFGYDLMGNIVRYTNFNAIVITNMYDPMNRITNRSSTNGFQISWAYTPTGKRAAMVDASGTNSSTYDLRERLRTNSTPQGTLYYGYDVRGNVTNIWSSTTNGVNLRYEYDSLNRLKTVTNVLGGALIRGAAYGFDLGGNLQSIAYGNGVTNLYQYDALNRPTNLLWKLNASILASFYYQLGATGNRTNLLENVNSTGRTNRWGFDQLYRLTNEVTLTSSSSGTNFYRFDDVGNRTNLIASIPGITSQTNGFGPNDWLLTDAYDNNGNTLWSTNAAIPSGPFQYDAENHLISVSNGAITFVYNGDGIRVRKSVSGSTTLFLVDEKNPTGYPQVLEEATAIGGLTNLSRVYNYGLQLVSQHVPGASTNFFIFDGHNSTRVLADNNGNVVNAFTFDAYGNLIASNAAPQTDYLFSGHYLDPELKFYYLLARFYLPKNGRFWTRDSWEGYPEDPLTLNQYLFCNDNPIDLVDPSGHWSTVSIAPIHQGAIDQELAFLPETDRSALRYAQTEVDKHQSASESFMHAMRNGSEDGSAREQSRSDARWLANFFVRGHLLSARRLQAKGQRLKAMSELGQAMHTLQDSTSPMHHGFQAWYNYFGGASNPHEWVHAAGETINPGPGSWLFKATHAAYDYFNSNDPLPKDFFDNLGGDTVASEFKALGKRLARSLPDLSTVTSIELGL